MLDLWIKNRLLPANVHGYLIKFEIEFISGSEVDNFKTLIVSVKMASKN